MTTDNDPLARFRSSSGAIEPQIQDDPLARFRAAPLTPEPREPISDGSSLDFTDAISGGFKRGLYNVAGSVGSVGSLAQMQSGDDLEDYFQGKAESIPRAATLENFLDSPKNFAVAVGENVAEQVPNALAFFLSRGATKRAAMSRGVSEKAAGRLGNVAGAVTTAPLNIAESKQAIEDRDQEATFGNVLPVATFNTLLDTAVLVQVARKFGLGKEAKEALQESGIVNGLWRVTKDTVEVAATEGITEVMQTASNQAVARVLNSEGAASLTQADKRELLESGVFGALGGGGLAGAASTAGQAAGLFGGGQAGRSDQSGGLVPTPEGGPQGANKQGPFDPPDSSPNEVSNPPAGTPEEQQLDLIDPDKPVDPQPKMGEPGSNGPPSVTDESPLTQIADPRADEFSPEEQRVRQRVVTLDAMLRQDGIDMEQEFHILAQGQFTDPQQAAAVAELAAYQDKIESGELREDIFEELPSIAPEALQGIRWENFQFSDDPDGAGVAVDPQDPEFSIQQQPPEGLPPSTDLNQEIRDELRLQQLLDAEAELVAELEEAGEGSIGEASDTKRQQAVGALGFPKTYGGANLTIPMKARASAKEFYETVRAHNQSATGGQRIHIFDEVSKGYDILHTPVKQGEVRSVGLDGELSPELGEAYRATVRQWQKALMPDSKIIIMAPQAKQDILQSKTPGVATVLDDGTIIIGFDPDLRQNDYPAGRVPDLVRDDFLQTHTLEDLSHEFGHGLIWHQFGKESRKVQAAIYKAHMEYLRDMRTIPVYKFLEKWFPGPEATVWARIIEKKVGANQDVTSTMFAILKERKDFGYYADFDEFLARQIARWMTKADRIDKVLPKETHRFWQKAMNLIRSFFARNKVLQDQHESVDAWMRTLALRTQILEQRKKMGLPGQADSKPATGYKQTAQTVGKDVAAATEQLAPMPLEQRPPMLLKASNAAEDSGLQNVARDTEDHGTMHIFWRRFIQLVGTPLQIAERFNVPEAVQYMDQVDKFNRTKMEQIERADRIAVDWRKLGGGQADTLSQFLFQVSQRSDELGRPLTDAELIALGQKMKLGQPAFDLWRRIDTSFRDLLDRIEAGLVLEAEQTIEVDVELQERVQEIRSQMKQLKNRNYFPRSRFGNYTVRIRARDEGVVWDGKKYKKGETIEFRTYETEKERARDIEILRKKTIPGVGVSVGKLDDTQYTFMGMPPVLIESVKRALDQGEQGMSQDQKDRLNDIALQMNPGRTFMRHLQERKGIKGFSEDAMRTYANYMMSASNHLARVQHNRPMFGKIKDMDDRIRYLSQSGEFTDTTTLDEIRTYYKRHFDYVMNPDNDWAKIRAMGFLWYLGANVKSALVNTTQVPLVTYPVLAGQYGDVPAMGAITKAMKDVRWQLEKVQGLEGDEAWMMEEMSKEGIIDESMVMELAGMGESTVLSRLAPGNSFDKTLNQASYYGGWMFRTAEKFNRRVTALASFRLAMKNGKDRQTAFDEAKDAIRKSQFEYAKWNRPEFMRGKKSVIFLFWQYMQHASYLATNGFFSGRKEGRQQAIRFWTMMAFAGGLQGLPFAEHILDMIDIFGTKAKDALGSTDPKVDLRNDLRDFILEMEGNPDLIMHGLSKYYGLGPVHLLELMGAPIPNTDVSGSLSMGRMVPWLDNSLKTSDNPDAKLGRVLVDVLGPVGAVPYNLYRSMESPSPDTWKNVERNLPVFLKSASRGLRWGMRGAETDSGDARMVTFDPEDIEHRLEQTAQMLGFIPTRVSQAWAAAGSKQEARMYWALRYQMILDDFGHAVATGDKEQLAEMRKIIRGFNQQLPKEVRTLAITHKKIKQSMTARARARALKERGLPTQPAYGPLYREMDRLYPQGSGEQR